MTNQSIPFDYDTAAALSRDAHAAIDTLNRIAALDDPRCDISIAIRCLLIDRNCDNFDDCPDAQPHLADIRTALAAIDARIAYPYAESARHALSDLLLSYSLCPMHAIDYAICFDDDTDECATIRAYFPIHDT